MTRQISDTVTTLPNGLRILHRHINSDAEHFGVIVDAGSRDENSASHGLAHFVEHTIFKGTEHRRPWHILNRMEAVGGELNAYTTKEETVIYTVAPRGNLRRAAELVGDIIFNATFPEKELEKEKSVIEDEISSYLDTPSEAIFDELDEHIFAGSPMAHNILGTAESISRLGSDDCRRWINEFYIPENMVVFYSGAVRAPSAVSVISSVFSSLRAGRNNLNRISPPINQAFDIVRPLGLHQAHTLAAKRLPVSDTPESRSLNALICNILGGPGMNSLLNLQLRERKALVYTIESVLSFFSDSTLFTIYYGCDPEDDTCCKKLVKDILESLSTLSPYKLNLAKKQLIGQVRLAGQNLENTAISSARMLLRYSSLRSVAHEIEGIAAVTHDAFIKAAEDFNTLPVSFLTYR